MWRRAKMKEAIPEVLRSIELLPKPGSWHRRPVFDMSVTVNFPSERPKGIGLFDLDGTLIAWDCQLLFRHFVVRRQPWRGIFLPIFLLHAPLAKLLGTETMKRVFLSYLWGMDEAALHQCASKFADAVMPAIYPEVKEMLEEHQRKGHFTILASASPEIYVREIGKRLGFDLSLGTEVEWGGLFPELSNHKGQAKVVRLHQVLPPEWFDAGGLRGCHGYSDSTADLPMLEICEDATVVNPGARLEGIAAASNWRVVRPGRPWRSRLGLIWRSLALLVGIGRDPGGLNPK